MSIIIIHFQPLRITLFRVHHYRNKNTRYWNIYAGDWYLDPDVLTRIKTRPNRGNPSLQWRHNGSDSVSNHQPHDCFLNRLFRHRSKKTSKLRVTGLCAGKSPEAGEFPSQMASNAENVSIWWRHHVHLWIITVLDQEFARYCLKRRYDFSDFVGVFIPPYTFC